MSSRSERRFERYEYADPETHPFETMRPFISDLLLHHTEVKATSNSAQLKLSPALSFYPTKRSVYIDGDPSKLQGFGVVEVVRLLEQRGELCPP